MAENIEFNFLNPAKKLIQAGQRRAGSAVRKGFSAAKKIPGKTGKFLTQTPGRRKLHTGAIRESLAPNMLIKDRYSSMQNWYIGRGLQSGLKKGISGQKGIATPGGSRAVAASRRGRGIGATTTAARAVGKQKYIAGSLLPQVYERDVKNLIRLDDALEQAIELARKRKSKKTLKDLSHRTIARMRTGQLYAALSKILR